MKKNCIRIYDNKGGYSYEVGTLLELSNCFKDILEAGKKLEVCSGNKKVNMNYKTAKGLVRCLNNAEYNRTFGIPTTYYELAA